MEIHLHNYNEIIVITNNNHSLTVICNKTLFLLLLLLLLLYNFKYSCLLVLLYQHISLIQ